MLERLALIGLLSFVDAIWYSYPIRITCQYRYIFSTLGFYLVLIRFPVKVYLTHLARLLDVDLFIFITHFVGTGYYHSFDAYAHIELLTLYGALYIIGLLGYDERAYC